ncbi:hypothetical protein [Tardiphaga sp. 813_E8_N1_3]|uniref:hypothetical protein n=1 Tax=Tardiphaga sp. 813_E8_N1_3 TaxID=3240760 RepID=UPI003F1E558D
MLNIRALFCLGLLWCSALSAAEIDYSKIDYSQYARPERLRLAKCFGDMLEVVERHRLRTELLYFLEAGCSAEMRAVENALSKNPPPGLEGLDGRILAPSFIGPMEQRAEERYASKKVSFCSGETCVLERYRECAAVEAQSTLRKRLKPADFEASARKQCGSKEAIARAALVSDFTAAQQLQQSIELSSKTRELIERVIAQLRQQAVADYAEALTKIDPARKSCKIPVQMCGNSECFSLDDVSPAQREYECAVQR